MRISTAVFAAIAVVLTAVVGVSAVAAANGGLINTTPSYPRGLYLRVDRPARIGDLVAFCPNRAIAAYAVSRGYLVPGRCPAGSVPLIKRLAAAAGDQVAIGPRGVAVDGKLLTNSSPRAQDGLGRPLPRLRMAQPLAAGEILLMSDYEPASFDSRYFGPVDRTGILTPVRPILTMP